MSSDVSHATAKIRQDHPSNFSDERPPKRPRHLASRARQKCRGLLLGAEPVTSCPAAAPAHLPIPDGLIAMDPGEICIKDPSPAPCAATLFEPAAAMSNGMQCSLDALDATLTKFERADKGMNDAYARHVRNYVAYWDQYQAEMVANNPTWTSVPALPISAAKVLIFLNHERTREKRKPGSSDTIPGSNVGKSVIQQAISALEDWRMSHHHLYLGVPEAQVRLRDDNRIRQIESAAKHDEPKRAESSQVLKASGTTSDAYTTEELTKCSGWCLWHWLTMRRAINMAVLMSMAPCDTLMWNSALLEPLPCCFLRVFT
ncbi:hypothetical protein EV424DRAFT_1364804 [Suillus variegatus]|nr:hypothetical protein EV424DRAFT_1364804 [Suillus variegatus]